MDRPSPLPILVAVSLGIASSLCGAIALCGSGGPSAPAKPPQRIFVAKKSLEEKPSIKITGSVKAHVTIGVQPEVTLEQLELQEIRREMEITMPLVVASFSPGKVNAIYRECAKAWNHEPVFYEECIDLIAIASPTLAMRAAQERRQYVTHQ